MRNKGIQFYKDKMIAKTEYESKSMSAEIAWEDIKTSRHTLSSTNGDWAKPSNVNTSNSADDLQFHEWRMSLSLWSTRWPTLWNIWKLDWVVYLRWERDRSCRECSRMRTGGILGRVDVSGEGRSITSGSRRLKDDFWLSGIDLPRGRQFHKLDTWDMPCDRSRDSDCREMTLTLIDLTPAISFQLFSRQNRRQSQNRTCGTRLRYEHAEPRFEVSGQSVYLSAVLPGKISRWERAHELFVVMWIRRSLAPQAPA
jgi:hypothetical protein